MTRQKIREILERLDQLKVTPNYMLISETSDATSDTLALLQQLSTKKTFQTIDCNEIRAIFTEINRKQKTIS